MVTIDDQQEVAYALSIGTASLFSLFVYFATIITVNKDFQWPWMTLNGHFFQNTCVFGTHHETLNEDRPTLLAAEMY